MNPEQERKAKVKELEALESELGLTPRREINALLVDVVNGLTHLENLAKVNSYQLAHSAPVRQVYHNWRRHMTGMIKGIEAKK